MNKKTNLIVQLRWIKGAQATYDKSGNIQNESGITKLWYGSLEWSNYLKQAKTHGFCELEAVDCKELITRGIDAEYEAIDVPEYISLEVDACLRAPKAVLTPEQERIAQLEAKLEALLNKESKPKQTKKEVVEEEEIEEEEKEVTIDDFKPKKKGKNPQAKK